MVYCGSWVKGRSPRKGRARLREGPSRGTVRGTTAALLCALLIAFALVPLTPAAALARPVLTHFERTSPDTINAGDTLTIEFSTDIPVASGTLKLSNGLYPHRDFNWGNEEGPELTQHVIIVPTDAGSWLGRRYLVESLSFRYSDTHLGATIHRSHPGGQSFAAADFTVINSELTADRPELVEVEVTSDYVLAPGEAAVVAFGLTAPAQSVKLHYKDESLLNSKVLEWTGSPGPGPFTGEVSMPIEAGFFESEYELHSVQVFYLGGQAQYSFARESWPIGGGDFFVVNPDNPLQAFENLTPPEISINDPANAENRLEFTLGHTSGTWSKTPTSSFGRWRRDGAYHCGSMFCNSAYYVTSASDLGSVVDFELTVMLEGHKALTVLSNPMYFSRTGPATVVGSNRVGSELRVSFDPSTVTPMPEGAARAVVFEWKDAADPANVLATGDTYQPTLADVGRTVHAVAVVEFDGQTVARVVSNNIGPIAQASRLSDFNNDGSNDLFAVAQNGVLRMYGASASGWASPAEVGWGWDIFSLVFSPGDFNGDGNVDVMARDSGGDLLLYEGDGRGGWLLQASVVGTGWSVMTDIMGPGDFNGDGTSDVLAKDRDGRLLLYPGNGDGGWLAPSQVGYGWNIFNKVFAPGDFDGDGGPDVMARDGKGDLVLYQNDGNGNFVGLYTIGTGWDALATFGSIGDIDGDGWLDLYAIDHGGLLMAYHHNATGWDGPHPIGPDWNTLKFVF